MKKTRADEILEHAIGMAGVEAQEAGSITYSPRCTLLATLPHSDPGDVPVYGRVNGGYGLFIHPCFEVDESGKVITRGYPYGIIPRLIMAWLTAEAVRTKSRLLGLGDNLADFLGGLELGRHGGARGDITRLKDQMNRLFCSRITIRYQGEDKKRRDYMQLVATDHLWWDPAQPEDERRQHAFVLLGEQFYQEIVDRPVPLDMRVIRGLRRSSMAMDIYSWLTYRTSYLKRKTLIPWASLKLQFGADYGRARDFKKKFLEQLWAVKALYSHARFSTESEKGLTLYPSRPSVLKTPKIAKPKTKITRPKIE